VTHRQLLTHAPSQARARIDELHRAGADTVVLIPAGPDPFAALAALARLV